MATKKDKRDKRDKKDKKDTKKPPVVDRAATPKGSKAAKDRKKGAKKQAKGVGTPVVPLTFTQALRAVPGTDLAAIDTRSTPAFDGDKAAGEDALFELGDVIDDLQERLHAEAVGGGHRSVLLVIQGMDTSGKGGIMRHVVGAMEPQGLAITSFKQPTAEERSHPFLWRIRKALPGPGMVGVFDRSHYEDVLVVRVHDLVPRAQWSRRYGQINTFERGLVQQGTTVIKVLLHISRDEQGERLAKRLSRPDKYWKYNPGDLDERDRWADYQEAYQAVVDRCSTDEAPWFVVPADRKWYARLAVMQLLREHLEILDPQWPPADFDVEAEQHRLAEQG